MGQPTGRFVHCQFATFREHGRVAIEVMRGKNHYYARCPLEKCGALRTWPVSGAPSSAFTGMTREEALAVEPTPHGPLTKEEVREHYPDAVTLPEPSDEELEEQAEEADRLLEEIEAEEKEDVERHDGGAWPPKL